MNAVTAQPSLAPAALNSVAPVPPERCARSRPNCTASPPLIGGGAARRIESLSAVALPDLGEKGGGERWRWVSKPKPYAPWPLASGRQRRAAMRRYKCDPRSITVRFEGNCLRCKRAIHPGERAFYYPEDRSLYREAEECGKAASREFSAGVLDEEHNTSS